jgi:hypothetical protein
VRGDRVCVGTGRDASVIQSISVASEETGCHKVFPAGRASLDAMPAFDFPCGAFPGEEKKATDGLPTPEPAPGGDVLLAASSSTTATTKATSTTTAATRATLNTRASHHRTHVRSAVGFGAGFGFGAAQRESTDLKRVVADAHARVLARAEALGREQPDLLVASTPTATPTTAADTAADTGAPTRLCRLGTITYAPSRVPLAACTHLSGREHCAVVGSENLEHEVGIGLCGVSKVLGGTTSPCFRALQALACVVFDLDAQRFQFNETVPVNAKDSVEIVAQTFKVCGSETCSVVDTACAPGLCGMQLKGMCTTAADCDVSRDETCAGGKSSNFCVPRCPATGKCPLAKQKCVVYDDVKPIINPESPSFKLPTAPEEKLPPVTKPGDPTPEPSQVPPPLDPDVSGSQSSGSLSGSASSTSGSAASASSSASTSGSGEASAADASGGTTTAADNTKGEGASTLPEHKSAAKAVAPALAAVVAAALTALGTALM